MELICHPHIHWNSTPLLASCIVLLSVSLYFYMICLRMVCELKLNVSVKFSCALHAGSSSSGFTTVEPPSTGLRLEAVDIAVVVVYFIFVMVVGIWVRPESVSTHFTLTS